MTLPHHASLSLVEEIARVIHAHGVIAYGITREWDRVVPKLQEQYREEARAVLASRPIADALKAKEAGEKFGKTIAEHLSWLDVFASDDDAAQERNWRDNMMRIRAQLRSLRSDLSAALALFQPKQSEDVGS